MKKKQPYNPVVIIICIVGGGILVFMLMRSLGSYLNSPDMPAPSTEKTSEDIRRERDEFVAQRETKEEVVPIAMGSFDESTGNGSGDILVYKMPKLPDTLWLQNIEVNEGPDLHVIALPFESLPDDATIAQTDYLDIGPLQSTSGDQEYKLPDEFDIETHKTIAIWCVTCEKTFLSGVLE